MYAEEDLLPLSGLQHWIFCPRQFALIHLEQVWADNHLTAEGRALHEKAHTSGHESRPGIRIARSLPVRSLTLGLAGQCDVVEFHDDGRIIPVEYKRGRPKPHRADEVQLCAQALCLEEMLECSIPEGFLFYGENRRRTPVAFDAELRALTTEAASAIHRQLAAGTLPPAHYTHGCDSCSLIDICQPRSITPFHFSLPDPTSTPSSRF